MNYSRVCPKNQVNPMRSTHQILCPITMSSPQSERPLDYFSCAQVGSLRFSFIVGTPAVCGRTVDTVKSRSVGSRPLFVSRHAPRSSTIDPTNIPRASFFNRPSPLRLRHQLLSGALDSVSALSLRDMFLLSISRSPLDSLPMEGHPFSFYPPIFLAQKM